MKRNEKIVSEDSGKKTRENPCFGNGTLLRRMAADAGILLLGLGTIGISDALTSSALAQSANDAASQKNFLQRLRPPFMKPKEPASAPGQPLNSNSAVPSGFAELEETPYGNSGSAPSGTTGTAGTTGSDGWSPIGTAYATPSSSIPPDSSARLLNASGAYNPSSRASAPSGNGAPSSLGTPRAAAYPTGTSGMGAVSGQNPAGVSSPASNPAASPASSPASIVASTGNSSLPAPFPVNQREFHLPFENFLSVVPQDQLQGVRLYVSRDNGSSWKAYQTLTRDQIQGMPNKNFAVRTASDGEFWFAVRVMNQQGAELPGGQQPPTWRILVNSTGKPLDSLMNQPNSQLAANGTGTAGTNPPAGNPVNPQVSASGIARPQWSPNPDGSLAASTPNASEGVAGEGNAHASQNPNLVIYSVKDRGVNSIPDVSLPVYRIQNSKPIDAFLNPGGSANAKKHVTAKPETASDSLTAPDDSGLGDLSELDGTGGTASLEGSIQLDDSPASDSGPGMNPDPLSGSAPDSETDSSLAPGLGESSAEETADDLLLTMGDSASSEEGLNARIRFINQPNLTVDYDVSTVGSSGVGRVELWGTLDDGQTWTYMADDKDCTSPINLTLKADGKYGFQILVFNGAGVGMERPQAGSAPQMEVVLDRINPRVQLYSIQLQAEFGDLEISWGAEDLNLGSNPVMLSWSSSTEGPWRAMTAMPIENSGRFNWRIPDGVPGKVFIRIDVCDQAKNSTTLVTGPVVTDIVRPTGVIRDAKPTK